MPSNDWRALGPGNLLGFLRADLKKATQDVWIIGPWIDYFFAEMVVKTCPTGVALRVLSRPLDAMSPAFLEHARAARQSFATREHTEFRCLPALHAKVLVFDDKTIYCGSANWYRYSLEDSVEIVLRGTSQAVPTLLDELASLWDQAVLESTQSQSRVDSPVAETTEGYGKEILDPIVAAKLSEVPGSFIRRRKPSRG